MSLTTVALPKIQFGLKDKLDMLLDHLIDSHSEFNFIKLKNFAISSTEILSEVVLAIPKYLNLDDDNNGCDAMVYYVNEIGEVNLKVYH